MRAELTLALAGFIALSPLLQAEKLKNVRHQSLGFSVDLPAWNIMQMEEDVSSIRVTTGAAISVGRFHMQDKTLEEIKAIVVELSSNSETEGSLEDVELPAGPAIHWRGVKQKGDQREVSHSYFIEARGVVYSIDCRSLPKTDQEVAAGDKLCEKVASSLALN